MAEPASACDCAGELSRIAAALERIATATEGMNTHIAHLDSLGSSDSEGIRARHVCVECGPKGFQKAILVNALKQSNQLDNCISEFNNPTAIPGL